MSFLSSYDKWNDFDVAKKKKTVLECVKFYEEKTVQYILSNLTNKKRNSFKRQPVQVEFVSSVVGESSISFADNVVYILNSLLEGGVENKRKFFFKVAENTICAVFANMFSDTTTNPDKHTKFGKIATGFLASITSEFAKGASFENDMMQEFTESLSEEMSISME